MALIEALVAAAILGLALSAYIALAQGGSQSARLAEQRVQLLSSAEALLDQAHGSWPRTKLEGRDLASGAAWTMRCEQAPLKNEADRLALVTCTVAMHPQGIHGAIGAVELRLARAHARHAP